MRIAFTHNVQRHHSEAEAEFDTPQTVSAITQALKSLGHTVFPVEVSGSVRDVVAELDAIHPDLIFNTAEGLHGRCREAFFPALFEELGYAFTGSDPYVCTLTLDKGLTKAVLAEQKIPTPQSVLVTLHDVPHLSASVSTNTNASLPSDVMRRLQALHLPVILKPNFEGSSKGITVDSIVDEADVLVPKLQVLLDKYPEGILVEEFIVGIDVVVPYLAAASPETGGILEPVSYHFDEKVVAGRKYQIYDYVLKCEMEDAVEVEVPARISQTVRAELISLSKRIFDVLGIRDLGRIDYRITDDGRIYFLEVNALPSLEPGAGIYRAAAAAGLPNEADVLAAVVESACTRLHLAHKHSTHSTHNSSVARPIDQSVDQSVEHSVDLPTAASSRRVVGLTYNLKRQTPTSQGQDDEAEFDSPKTVEAIAHALRTLGYGVQLFEADARLPERLSQRGHNLDLVFNIAEGLHGRSREAQVPALLDMLGINHTGSDATAMAVTLDKTLAKRIVKDAGVPTAAFVVFQSRKTLDTDLANSHLRFPVIVKPQNEGSSKGITDKSVVANLDELRERITMLFDKYHQPVLAEEFLSGREFTVAVLGNENTGGLRVLPPMEIVFLDDSIQNPIYSFQHKLDWSSQIRYDCPAQIPHAINDELQRLAKMCFFALSCRDVARFDFRLDAAGKVNFIECNPLPGMTPSWSDLCIIAEKSGLSYADLIGTIVTHAFARRDA